MYKLVVEPGGGLCNRIIAINNAVNLDRNYDDINVCFCWWKEPELGCSYSYLFNDIGYSIKEKSRKLMSTRTLLKQGDVLDCINGFFGNCYYNFYYRDNNKRRLDIKNNPDLFHNEKELSDLVHTYPVNSTLYLRFGNEYYTDFILDTSFIKSNYFDEAYKLFNLKKHSYIGVHIRRTDNISSIAHSPLCKFEAFIEYELSVSPSLLIYLSSDDIDVINYLKNKYPENILFYEGKSFDRNVDNGIHDAMIDFVMLCNSSKIYGSYGSTFSLVPSKLGHIPLII